MGLKKELTVHSCTATRLTYVKIRQRVGSYYHRSLWQTAPCVFVRQQMPATQVRAIPFNSHTPTLPLSSTDEVSWLPFTRYGQKYRHNPIFLRNISKIKGVNAVTPRKKLASVPPPPTPNPTSIYRYDFLWGWWWWWVVPWRLSEMVPHNENFCSRSRAFPLDKTQIQVTAVWNCTTCHFKKIVAVVPIYPLRITDVSIWSSRRSSDYILRGLDTIREIVREPGLSFSCVEMTAGY